ncbi:MAG: hypothetical protein GY796_11965 [Chloroflexi bacterium]|nr:hypothetical protein [Chloroflexota bacterium]
MLNNIERVTRPSQSTQFYLFNLFADYIVPRDGRIWTNDLLYLLDLLGVSERAARTALSRMKLQGWFTTHKDGRRTQYEITPLGQAILEEGDKRIFEEPFTDWDGHWHLVVYSLPEAHRKLRNELRKKLIWFGFGRLSPGSWVSARDWVAELTAVCQSLDVSEYVTMFTAVTANDTNLIQQCWDISALAADYQTFIQRHQSEYDAIQSGQQTLSPEDCFVQRFCLTYHFQRFPLKDPNLPAALLPDDWIGYTAHTLFRQYRQLLNVGMGDFIDDVIRDS